jgi:hypothetical protein
MNAVFFLVGAVKEAIQRERPKRPSLAPHFEKGPTV